MKEQVYLLDLEYYGIFLYNNLKDIFKDDHLTNIIYNEIIMLIITIVNDKGYNEVSLEYIKNITYTEAYSTLIKVDEYIKALHNNNYKSHCVINNEELLLKYFKEMYMYIFFSLHNKNIMNTHRDNSILTLLSANTRFLLLTKYY